MGGKEVDILDAWWEEVPPAESFRSAGRQREGRNREVY